MTQLKEYAPHTHTHKDTLSHQSGLGVESTELTSKQSVLVGSWGFDCWCLCLLNYSNLHMKQWQQFLRKRWKEPAVHITQKSDTFKD